MLLSLRLTRLAWSFILKGATNMLKKTLLITILSLFLIGCSQNDSQLNTLTVGMECNYAPFNWIQQEQDDEALFIEGSNGYCKGYDVSVAKELAKQLEMDLEIKVIAWEGLIPALNSGSIDAIIAGMSYTPERAQQVNFTQPYYHSDYVMIVHQDSSYSQATSLNDFRNARIVGQLGTNYDTIIDQIDEVNHLNPLGTYPLIVNAIISGAADGAPAEKPTAQSIIASNPELVMVEFEQGLGFTQTQDITTEVSIALRKDDEQLLSDINSILETIDQTQRDAWMLQAIESPHQ